MNTYIVDVSVGVKWFFDEESSEPAVWLVNQFKEKKIKIVVPEFFYVEFGNICWKKVQRKIIKTADMVQAIDDINQLSLQCYSDQELADVASENALQFGISVYDAIYISLAEVYGAPLVTADDVLVKACQDQFDFILPLKEFKV